MPERRYLLIVILVTIILLSVPYILGFQASNSQSQFGGFLINPVDGQSYLAKMVQGAEGEWKFKLPYTAEPGEGAYLFLFYLGLGHLSRFAQIPVVIVFHAARLVSSVWLIVNIDKLMSALFDNRRQIRIATFLAVLGSGLGWMAVLAGGFTSDLWVAEAYPFLSMYTNPHFGLGLAIMIHVLLPKQKESLVYNLLIGLALGIIQPFAVVILGIVKLLHAGLKTYHEAYLREFWTKRKPRTKHINAVKLQGNRNNNKMERLNGEIRDREKVMRGLKKDDTSILKGYQIYHNFIREHEGLNGKTPSEACGIRIEGKNKWQIIIQNASRNKK